MNYNLRLLLVNSREGRRRRRRRGRGERADNLAWWWLPSLVWLRTVEELVAGDWSWLQVTTGKRCRGERNARRRRKRGSRWLLGGFLAFYGGVGVRGGV